MAKEQRSDNITGYDLSRAWFDFSFENQGKVKPNHTALYFFCVENWNRMGQVKSFGLPTEMAKSAIGISSYNTYINTLNDLIEWGFITMVQKSQNQYSSNIVALSKNDKPRDKALDKALIKHGTKQQQKQRESIDSINKQLTINKEQITRERFSPPIAEEVAIVFSEKSPWPQERILSEAKRFIDFYDSNGWMVGKNKMKNWRASASGWISRAKDFDKEKEKSSGQKEKPGKIETILQTAHNYQKQYR